MGTFTAFFDLGVGVGSPLAGAAAALGGYEAAFLVAAACALDDLRRALAALGGRRNSRNCARIGQNHVMAKARWIAAGLALWGAIGSVSSAAADPAAPLFDPSSVAVDRVHAHCGGPSGARRRSRPSTCPRELQISADGRHRTTTPSGCGSRGRRRFAPSTARPRSRSTSSEFDGAKFLGLKKLTLNNMVQDPSMLRETLTYELFRAAGRPGTAHRATPTCASTAPTTASTSTSRPWTTSRCRSGSPRPQHLYEGELRRRRDRRRHRPIRSRRGRRGRSLRPRSADRRRSTAPCRSFSERTRRPSPT